MQEKIARMTKVVTNLTKGKEIIDGPSLKEEPTSWKDGIDPSMCQTRTTMVNKKN